MRLSSIQTTKRIGAVSIGLTIGLMVVGALFSARSPGPIASRLRGEQPRKLLSAPLLQRPLLPRVHKRHTTTTIIVQPASPQLLATPKK